MENYKSFEDLECWKEARKLRVFVKDFVIKNIPSDEKFVLINQVRRSSRSVGNNIAEGYGRFHYQENIQFCRMARGSLLETLDHIIVAFDENYISGDVVEAFRKLYDKTLLILNGYIKFLKKQKNK